LGYFRGSLWITRGFFGEVEVWVFKNFELERKCVWALLDRTKGKYRKHYSKQNIAKWKELHQNPTQSLRI